LWYRDVVSSLHSCTARLNGRPQFLPLEARHEWQKRNFIRAHFVRICRDPAMVRRPSRRRLPLGGRWRRASTPTRRHGRRGRGLLTTGDRPKMHIAAHRSASQGLFGAKEVKVVCGPFEARRPFEKGLLPPVSPGGEKRRMSGLCSAKQIPSTPRSKTARHRSYDRRTDGRRQLCLIFCASFHVVAMPFFFVGVQVAVLFCCRANCQAMARLGGSTSQAPAAL